MCLTSFFFFFRNLWLFINKFVSIMWSTIGPGDHNIQMHLGRCGSDIYLGLRKHNKLCLRADEEMRMIVVWTMT